MGLILDSSVASAAERRGDTVQAFLQRVIDTADDQEAVLSPVGVALIDPDGNARELFHVAAGGSARCMPYSSARSSSTCCCRPCIHASVRRKRAANDVALIEPRGFLMLNYGRSTFLINFAAHVAYGIIVGLAVRI